MKETAGIVTIARGGCIDTEALTNALTTGEIAQNIAFLVSGDFLTFSERLLVRCQTPHHDLMSRHHL